MNLRQKIFWGILYTVIYGYLLDGLLQFNESPFDAVDVFPLKLNRPVRVEEGVQSERSKPI